MTGEETKTKAVPPLFLQVALFLLLTIAFSPLVSFAAIFVALAFSLISTSRFIPWLVALAAAILGIWTYGDYIHWLYWPMAMTLKLYQSENILATLSLWLSEPRIWALQIPSALFFGAIAYAMRLLPLEGLKRTSNLTSKCNGKVGDLSALANDEPDKHLEGSVIGEDKYGRQVELMDKNANQHTLVLGTTGSGKTVTVCNIVESAINRGLPLIYVDGKGDYELAKRIAAYGRDKGRTVSIFSMNGESIAYNPLATGGFTSKKDRIVALRDWSEEHYKKLAEGYLQTVFKVMDRCGIATDMVTLSNNLDLKRLKALVRENESRIPDAQSLMDELTYQDQAAKSIESLIAEIRNFTLSEIGEQFRVVEGEPVLTLEEVIATGGIAYFCLPALEFPSMSQTIGRLIVNDLKATMAQQLNQDDKKKVYVIFDEFSVFAGEQVLNVINMGRSAGIHAVLSTQSLSDIASGRKDNADHFINQVIGNCNNFILHRQNSAEDAERLAEMIGTRKTLEYTSKVDEDGTANTGSIRRSRGFITHPDEIKKLQTGEAYFLSKEGNKVKKLKIRKSVI